MLTSDADRTPCGGVGPASALRVQHTRTHAGLQRTAFFCLLCCQSVTLCSCCRRRERLGCPPAVAHSAQAVLITTHTHTHTAPATQNLPLLHCSQKLFHVQECTALPRNGCALWGACCRLVACTGPAPQRLLLLPPPFPQAASLRHAAKYPAASALVLMRFLEANQSSCAAACSCCCSWCTARCRVTPAGCRRCCCCCFPSSTVSEQQQAQPQQASRSTCQAGIHGILLGPLVVAGHVGHVLEALVLVWDFVSVAHNPVQAR